MVSKYKEYEERIKQLGYSDQVIKVVVEMIRLADENITSPSKHTLAAEAQKIVENNYNAGDNI